MGSVVSHVWSLCFTLSHVAYFTSYATSYGLHCIHSLPVNSSQLGPENCTATVALRDSPMLTILFVPSGTVCLECIIGGALATEASFQIENMEVAPSEGKVVNGTLVVFDSETTFSEKSIIVRCMSGSASRHEAFVKHGSKSNIFLADAEVISIDAFVNGVIIGVTLVKVCTSV